MAPRYAKDQPAGFKNKIEKVAIVGAGGQVGSYVTQEILKIGHQKVTALTRPDSTSKMPEGVDVKKVDYNDHASVVEALRGQDVIIITMNVMAPPDSQQKLIDAAAEAGVPWIVPNEWGYDGGDAQLRKDLPLRSGTATVRQGIEKTGKLSWIGIACGFWYEFSLAGVPHGASARFGFDFEKKEVVLYDEGNTKINLSTWPQTGRGTARLLDLKILKDDANDTSPCLDDFRNRFCYISSFHVTQREIWASVMRVTDTKESEWTVKYEDVQDRFKAGQAELASGDRAGFAKLLYSRYFFKDGQGNYEGRGLLNNDLLGLRSEDIDEYTKISLDINKRGGISYG